MFKLVVVLVFFGVVGVLFSCLYFLIKDPSESKRTANALAWRVGLAALLIAIVAIGVLTGQIEPRTAP